MRILFLALIYATLLPRSAQAADPDAVFLAARDAALAADTQKLDALAPKLRGHPLESYVRYWQLNAHIRVATAGDVRSFFSRYPDSPLVDRLRGDWLKDLGLRAQWDLFMAEYPLLVNGDLETTCFYLQARLAQGEEEAALGVAHSLWFTGKVLPDSCSPLFDRMIATGRLSTSELWERVRLALDAGNVSLAKQINISIPEGQLFKQKTLENVAADPQRFLDKGRPEFDTRADRELVIFALTQVARSDAGRAAAYFDPIAARFPASEQDYVWGQIAYRGAVNLDPQALAWYAKAGDSPLTDTQLAWLARSALRAQNWDEVLAAIERMTDAERADSTWRYWRGRALKAQGKHLQAMDILVPLARETNFYGLLAAEEIGATLSSPPDIWKPLDSDLKKIQAIPGIQRALHLNNLGLAPEALQEWLYASRDFDDRQLLASAEVAKRADWIDRAINTADKTRQVHDLSLRFPTPYRDVLDPVAKANQLDEAWIYGLMRQESRFKPEVRSRVGAAGLMQLMPTTARWVARKLGIPGFRQSHLTQVGTNLSFGTYYLRYVLDRLGDPVMATAGYNAGPNRPGRWLGDAPMEGAIYAESIPLNETRDYVKKVMANATLYSNRLGLQWQSLKERLGTMPARSGAPDQATDIAGD
jgi:soluble lytic murein transglycosylase